MSFKNTADFLQRIGDMVSQTIYNHQIQKDIDCGEFKPEGNENQYFLNITCGVKFDENGEVVDLTTSVKCENGFRRQS